MKWNDNGFDYWQLAHLLTSLSTSCCLCLKKVISLLMAGIPNIRTRRGDAACCVPKASSSSVQVCQVAKRVLVMDLHSCLAVTTKLGSILNLFFRCSLQITMKKKLELVGINWKLSTSHKSSHNWLNRVKNWILKTRWPILLENCQEVARFEVD